jgi:phosphoglycolate phosphatase-like HAD superfamily hydrolase/pyrimidine operon attenuation protein/uracil phosphoribosyltransferase
VTWDAILFDFDDTLADTRSLKSLRDRAWRQSSDTLWKDYFGKVALARPVVADGASIAARLVNLSDAGLPIAVVTASPSKAVRVWFDHHYGWRPRVIVGYGEAAAKPDPQPFQLALRRLGIRESPMVLSVGDSAKDVLTAYNARVTSGTFERRVPLSAPADVFLTNTRALEDLTRAFALATSPPLGTASHAGVQRRTVRRDDRELLVGGRYHVAGGAVHDAIIASKSGRWKPWLLEAAVRLVDAAAIDQPQPPVLTSVPPHQGERDRFAELRQHVSTSLGIQQSADVVTWTRHVGKLTSMGATQRQTAMSGALAAHDVAGRTVILIDDVRTTGSTVTEAARAIRDAGGTPRIVILAQTLSKKVALPTDCDAEYLRMLTPEQREEERLEHERRAAKRRSLELLRRKREQAEQRRQREREEEERSRKLEREKEERRQAAEREREEQTEAIASWESHAERQQRARERSEELRRITEMACSRGPNRKQPYLDLGEAWSAQIERAKEWNKLLYVEQCAGHYHLVRNDPGQPMLQVGISEVPLARTIRMDVPGEILDILRGEDGAPGQ